jgi:hypothetical protein
MNLNEMIGGWFVGDFEPSILQSSSFEVAVKIYRKGEQEKAHLHKLAKEITVIISGKVIMCGQIFEQGSIILLEENDVTAFEALADTVTVVVKTPSITNDKYFI